MNRKVIKLILNAVSIVIFGVALAGFFIRWVYVFIQGAGVQGQNIGLEVALNFGGFPQNLCGLFPLVYVAACLVFAIVMLIKRLVALKKEPKEATGGALRGVLAAVFFALCGIISMFLCLSIHSIMNIAEPKAYGGYYLGEGAYVTAYTCLVGGLLMFINESGLIKD